MLIKDEGEVASNVGRMLSEKMCILASCFLTKCTMHLFWTARDGATVTFIIIFIRIENNKDMQDTEVAF